MFRTRAIWAYIAMNLVAIGAMGAAVFAVHDTKPEVKVTPTTIATTTTVAITTTTTEVPHVAPVHASRGGSIENKLRRIAYCETGGTMNPKIVSKTGKFRGLFQFDISTWLSNGGGEFASDPIDATIEQQFIVARRLYGARGGQPWPICGRK